MLHGRAEVLRRRQKLKALVEAIDGPSLSAELIAQYARYVCILVSGHAEQCIVELASHFCANTASPPVHRYAAKQLARLQNVTPERLKQVIEAFDAGWWAELAANHADELDALGGVVAVRNAVAHGEEHGVTMARAREYFAQVSHLLDALSEFMDPLPKSSSVSA